MNTVELLLLSSQGDTVGKLPVANLYIGQSETPSDQTLPNVPIDQAACLYAQLTDALLREGFEVAIDEIDYRIAVSKAVLAPSDIGPIVIPLPVREIVASGDPVPALDVFGPDDPLDFDDLFAPPSDAAEAEGRS